MTSPDRRPDPHAPEPGAPESPGPEARAGDPYREWDAAYVLGALSPQERRTYEEHLAACPACQSALAEIAGLPGLLGQLSPADAAALVATESVPGDQDPGTEPSSLAAVDGGADGDDELPVTLLPQVISLEARRRRLVGAVVALAAALVVAVGVLGVAALRGDLGPGGRSTDGPFRLAFTQVVPSGMTALVDVVPVRGGTELRVECQYAEDPAQGEHRPDYDIVVRDRAGQATAVRSWTARTGKMMTPDAMSPLPVSKIDAVEIHPKGSSQALLEAKLR